jgi:hypothetical protein
MNIYKTKNKMVEEAFFNVLGFDIDSEFCIIHYFPYLSVVIYDTIDAFIENNVLDKQGRDPYMHQNRILNFKKYYSSTLTDILFKIIKNNITMDL